MNTNQLQRHYDQLTPRERVAALLKAAMRGDDEERAALVRTAPVKKWGVCHHLFYIEALEKLAAVHLLSLLSMGCAFYQGQGILYLLDRDPCEDDEERFNSIYEKLVELARTIKAVDIAWQEFCKGQGLDPEALLMALPGSGVYSPNMPQELAHRLETLPLLRAQVEILAPEPPDAAEIAEMSAVHLEGLKLFAGDQSGGWG